MTARAKTGLGNQADAGLVVVRDKRALQGMVDFILSPERPCPVVGLAVSEKPSVPVLSYDAVQSVTGPVVQVYFVAQNALLGRLERSLDRKFALPEGAARVWWPGVQKRSNSADHPIVVGLEGEGEEELLVEFARLFELSRPHVRRELKLTERARVLAEQELADARRRNRDIEQRLRNTQIERHAALQAAADAEMRLNVLLQEHSAGG
jgi:hypothetical protein